MAEQHTPGPWTFEERAGGSYYISAQQGPLTVCPARAHGEADARLIAAAPEMYEVLNALASDAKWQNAPDDLLKIARAVLSKIEG